LTIPSKNFFLKKNLKRPTPTLEEELLKKNKKIVIFILYTPFIKPTL
jgi:hypothetical protein